MTRLNAFGLAVVASISILAMAATAASATTLSINGVAQNKSIEITASLASGTSMIWKDEFGTTTDTCTSSELREKTESPFTGEQVGGAASTLTYSNCTHTTTVLARGKTDNYWIPGGFSATLYSTGTEVTIVSTFFGASAVCKTGPKTHIGVLTEIPFNPSKVHYNAKINCGILGSTSVTGTYTITSPIGLGAVS
jgi:hypothetical protein